MSNAFTNDLHKVGHIALETIESPAKLVSDLCKAETVLSTVIHEQGNLKTTLTSVVKDGVKLSAEIALVVASKGSNWIADAALVEAVKQFFLNDIQGQLVPEFDLVYGEIKTDVEAK